MKFRLYIDETGNSDLASSDNPNHRFLTLAGVAFDLAYIERCVSPELEAIKKEYFHSHPDEPVVFHRKDMVNRRGVFDALKDASVRSRFNEELLKLLTQWKYVVFAVTVDKLKHQEKYQAWRYDPYHYCLLILLERYVLYLEENGAQGDVMAESRGGKEDMRLKKAFEYIIDNGSEYITAERFLKSLTSHQLKVKPKDNNIAGLQVADMLAHPAWRDILRDHSLLKDDRADVFGDRIIGILNKKYYQKNNDVNGYGKKLLP